MRNFTGKLLGVVACLCWLHAPLGSAAEEEVVTTSSSSGEQSAGPAEPAAAATGASAEGATGPATGATAAEGNPSGAGVFSPTPLQIYASVSEGYDDNVNTVSSNKQSSAFTSGNVILDYTFGDPRLQLVLNGGAGGTYYYQHLSSQDYDIDLRGALGVTYKASPRLTLGSTILATYATEPSFQYAGGLNSRQGNYLYTTDKAFIAYAWARRFSTKTSYSFDAYNYDNNTVGAFSNRVANVFGNEFRFQLAPTTNLVAEYRYGIVSYENSTLDSTTHYALGGIDHIFNPRLSATLRGGAEFRSYDNDGTRNGPYAESGVTYALGRRTSVSWTTRYGIEEPDLPNAQSRTTFRTGLQTKFSMTSRIGAGLDVYYAHDDYNLFNMGQVVTSAFSDDSFDADVSLRYGITRLLGVQAGYHFTNVTSDAALREYSRNRFSAGLNLTF
jgi:hypothetical protein